MRAAGRVEAKRVPDASGQNQKQIALVFLGLDPAVSG
jgi:hypothetical protein